MEKELEFTISLNEEALAEEIMKYINIENTTKVEKQENHTLADLRQKLINDLYEKKIYTNEDVEILRILFN